VIVAFDVPDVVAEGLIELGGGQVRCVWDCPASWASNGQTIADNNRALSIPWMTSLDECPRGGNPELRSNVCLGCHTIALIAPNPKLGKHFSVSQ
jgi:hypothetical protein